MAGSGSPCGACKFLRRKCAKNCVFAPYFCHEQGADHFAAIHKVFGASNASKLLSHLPVTDRSDAAMTISYEAQARLQDPIYGCISHIYSLQQQVMNLQAQLASLKAQAAQCGINGSSINVPNPNQDMVRISWQEPFQNQGTVPHEFDASFHSGTESYTYGKVRNSGYPELDQMLLNNRHRRFQDVSYAQDLNQSMAFRYTADHRNLSSSSDREPR